MADPEQTLPPWQAKANRLIAWLAENREYAIPAGTFLLGLFLGWLWG